VCAYICVYVYTYVRVILSVGSCAYSHAQTLQNMCTPKNAHMHTHTHTQDQGAETIFMQSYRQCKDVHPIYLRPTRPSGSVPYIAFQVKFKGEHAVGDGTYVCMYACVCVL